MRLRPGLDVLWRAPGEIQLGTDPRWAVRLSGLNDLETTLLTDLEPGVTARALRAQAQRRGLPDDRVDHLLRLLDDAQLLCPEPVRPPVAGPRVSLTGISGDAAAWSLVVADGDGAALVRSRSDRVVGIVGLGRLGLQTAVVLAASGVGTLLLDDENPVTSADLGVGGYTPRDVGTVRTAAANRIVHDVNAEIRTHAPSRTEPDLLVVVEHGIADPSRARVVMATGTPHLSVVVREASVLVGPLVVPGRTPCLRCIDLLRAEADECWGVLAAQLAATSRLPDREESTLAAVCGSLAAAQVLAHLDGRPPTTSGAGLEVTLPETVPRLLTWSVHPDCGCTAIPLMRPETATCAAGRGPA